MLNRGTVHRILPQTMHGTQPPPGSPLEMYTVHPKKRPNTNPANLRPRHSMPTTIRQPHLRSQRWIGQRSPNGHSHVFLGHSNKTQRPNGIHRRGSNQNTTIGGIIPTSRDTRADRTIQDPTAGYPTQSGDRQRGDHPDSQQTLQSAHLGTLPNSTRGTLIQTSSGTPP